MALKQNIFRIWASRGQILEGITNSIFKREDVEQIAEHRLKICQNCPSGFYDREGTEGCMVSGTAPCCNLKLGGCGCSLYLKTRSLSAACEQGHWDAELTHAEEALLNKKLAL